MTTRSALLTCGHALLACSLLAAGACAPEHNSPAAARTAEVTVTATAIPPDGQCTHIIATRLADFAVVEYKGPLASASLHALAGDNRVTATAYPRPCGAEPADAPWVAAEQIVTFVTGPNTLRLDFSRNVNVGVDPQFPADPSPLVVRDGSLVRVSRNGEDTAGPNFALDGWEVKQIALPPAAPSETVLFTTEGKGLPYSPRGMAHLADGRFVFQVGETTAPLYVFDATGAPLATWPVAYAAGQIQWSNTDGFEAVDATHFVRTGWVDPPVNCDSAGNNCVSAGIDLLEAQTAADGSVRVAVTGQIALPAPYAQDYPVGVAPVGARFAVTTLPPSGNSNLLLVNADGTLAAGPTVVPGDVEGLFDDGAGRLVALDYSGHLTTYNDSDLTARAGEQASYLEGPASSVPTMLAWRSAGAGSYVLLTGDGRLSYATPALDSISDVGLDLSNFVSVSGMDYRPDTDELLLMDRFPNGVDPFPAVRFYNLATHALASTVALQTGITQPVRAFSLAYVPATQQIVANFRSTSAADTTWDAMAYTFNLDGTLASHFDLRPLGFRRILTVSYRAASDELIFVVDDIAGKRRIVVTDRAGTPHRSYAVGALTDLVDVAPIDSGASAGDLGAVTNQPSFFARIALP